MAFKLPGSVIPKCSATTGKRLEFVPKCRFSCLLVPKRQCSSKKDPHDLSEEEVQQMLKSSSPLRWRNLDEFWLSSPYPQGTVFRDFEEEPKKRDSSSKSVILFPGQGNQFVGMAKNLTKYPVAMDMFKVASDILGYNLLKLCLDGPENKLNDTEYCQPATFVCSLALLEKVKDEKPWAISNCVATCGYSLGELSALVFAGCMNFERGLNLVQIRAKAMAECCKKTPGGMLTIFTGPKTKLTDALQAAVDHCTEKGIPNPECKIASYLFPNCKVIAGNMEALNFLRSNAKKYEIKRHSLLPVSGAFHTTLMMDAADPVSHKVQRMELKEPQIRVFSNVTSKPYRDVKHIEQLLPKQIYSPVKWEQTMHMLLGRGRRSELPHLYECGPGRSLTQCAVKVNADVAPIAFAVEL